MTEIFNFFLRLIELHVSAFRSTTNIGNLQKALAHSRVVQVALLTLTGFVEWVSIVHIMAADGKLLQMLCILLNDVAFQISAAECLAQITNRKGQVKDRKPLTLLFSEDAMGYILRAATHNSGATPEQYYKFLKIFVQVSIRNREREKSCWFSFYRYYLIVPFLGFNRSQFFIVVIMG